MNCPHCNQPVPENNIARECSSCGRELPLAAAESPGQLPPVKIKWLWFWIALMAPPVLTLASAYFMRVAGPGSASNESLSPAIALLGGGAGGLTCGILLGLRLGKTSAARAGIAVLLAGVMIVVSVMLCFFGCSLGGYHFDIK
jgi:hypothetical protein